MEADLNLSNKILYGVRMMDNVRRFGLMPEDIYSEKNRMADDGTLAKVLLCLTWSGNLDCLLDSALWMQRTVTTV